MVAQCWGSFDEKTGRKEMEAHNVFRAVGDVEEALVVYITQVAAGS